MKITKRFLKTIIIFYILSAAISCGKNEPAPTPENEFSFKIQFFVGDVKVVRADGEASAKQGEQLNIDDVLVTGSKSSADILYGASGVIRVNEKSKILIAAIADDKGNDTVLDMEQGKVFAAFTKLKGTKFSVKTPTVVASVRGTSFSVESDKSGAKVSVLKGTVKADPIKDGNVIEEKGVDVQANYKTDYINEKTVEKIAAGNNAIAVTKMTTTETTALQNDTKSIIGNIDESKDLTPKEKEDIKKEMLVGADDKSDDKKADVKKSAKVGDSKFENTKAKSEDEKKKAEEIIKQKEEQIKKERISNIPTM